MKKSKNIFHIALGTNCVKSVCIRSYSGFHFPAFGLKTDQYNTEYGQFLHSDRTITTTDHTKFEL